MDFRYCSSKMYPAGLSRFELGEIQRTHDQKDYMCTPPEDLAKQLARIGLTPNASRFTVAQRVSELEWKLNQ